MTPQYFQVGEEVIIEALSATGAESTIAEARFIEPGTEAVQHGGTIVFSESIWAYRVNPVVICDGWWPQPCLRKKPKPASGSYDEVIGWVKMGCPKKVLEHE